MLSTIRTWLDVEPGKAISTQASGASDGPTSASRTRWRVAGGLVLFAALVLLPLFRHQGRGAWLTVWGEDGDIFYQQALAGGAGQFTRSFAGYLSLPPRLLSALAVHLPLEWLGEYYALAGTIVTALLAAFTYRSSAHWIASRWVRVGLAAFLVLMPAAGPENSANGVNTIWAFMAVLTWAVVSEQDGPADVLARALVAFLAVTSSAVGLAFAPIVLGWLIIRRTRAVAMVAVAYAVGAVVQLAVMLRAPDELAGVEASWSAADGVRLVMGRVYGTYLLGDRGADAVWRAHGSKALLVSTLVTMAICILAARGAGRRAQVMGALFLTASLVLFLVAALGRGTHVFRIGGQFILFQHIRYSVIPTFLLASGLAVLVSPPGGRVRGADRWWSAAFLAHLAVVSVACFTVAGYRSEGPTWREALEAGRVACEALPPDATVEVPQDQLRFWTVELTCESLADTG